MVALPSLFSPGQREDSGPPPYARSAYQLLNRAHRPFATEVRRELDSWFSRLPPLAAVQIAERFRSEDEAVHLGAFLEIYVHELALRMSANVVIDVGHDHDDARRPDFLLRCNDIELLVEATAMAGADVHDTPTKRHLDELHDAVNAVNAPAFFVDIDVRQHGSSTPPCRRVTERVQHWLDSLDADTVFDATSRDEAAPALSLTLGEWDVRFEAYALQPEHRDYSDHRVIGGRSDGGGPIDDLTPLRRKIKRKAGHYGELDKPYILVVLTAGTFVDDLDIESALMGPIEYRYDPRLKRLVGNRKRDGAWMGPTGPINKRLSGVLTLAKLSPGSVTAVEPTLWTNPWATHPIPHPGPWRRIEAATNGKCVEHPRTRTIADVFGLPEQWPAITRSGHEV
jgi:hypothetical protein